MLLAIAAITLFQAYWLRRSFREKRREIVLRSNALFKNTADHLRMDRLKIDVDSNIHVRYRSRSAGAMGMLKILNRMPMAPGNPPRERVNVVVTRQNAAFIRSDIKDDMPADSIKEMHVFKNGSVPEIVTLLRSVDSLQDTVSVSDLARKYTQSLKREKLPVPFTISTRRDTIRQDLQLPDLEKDNEVTIGFNKPITYTLQLNNITSFTLRRLSSQILVSILLVGLTALSFALLLRNLIQQRKLTKIKNDFISNITHELKTPIATVSVAIEALRNFDALHDPQRTQEYLAISSNELQRLSLLVDKVLKLSMFEKHQIELKEETIDLAKLVNEVVNSMKLQFDKYKAQVNVQLQGTRFEITGDRLHITSVLFNLLDNALKYSKDNPTIHIELKENGQDIQLMVTDNGIGISPEYHQKIFDKFFRVPTTDNTHNVKGYGLGLSYVAYVVKQQLGTIQVESKPGIGSRFIIKLPATA